MEWFVLLVMFVIYVVAKASNDKAASRKSAIRKPSNPPLVVTPTITLTVTHSDEETGRDRYADPDVVIIRDEIRNAVAAHDTAVCLLQALARIDGKTTEAERDHIFAFLIRQGQKLRQEHREWFYTSRSGEWYRAAENDVIDELLQKLSTAPLQYRIDVAACAEAIVASGGTPRKREAETLEKIRCLVREP